MAEYTNELPDHEKRMSNEQALDVQRIGAHARPRHDQPVPSQYLWAGGGEKRKSILGFLLRFFWG